MITTFAYILIPIQTNTHILIITTFAYISIPLSAFQSDNVKAEVFGVIGGVPIPFALNNPNACSNSGLTCPLVAGDLYTYKASLPVKRIYPSVSD